MTKNDKETEVEQNLPRVTNGGQQSGTSQHMVIFCKKVLKENYS